MSKSALIQVRIDQESKALVEDLYKNLGTSLSEAIRIFIFQSIHEQKFPFTPRRLGKPGVPKARGTLSIYKNYEKKTEERDTWVRYLGKSSRKDRQ